MKKKSGVFHHFKGTMARFVMRRSKLLQSGPSAWGGGFSASHTISRASGAIFTKTLKRLLLRMVITVDGEISVAGFLDNFISKVGQLVGFFHGFAKYPL